MSYKLFYSPQSTLSSTEFFYCHPEELFFLVIQSVAKDLGNTMAGVNVDVHEILRRYAPLDDRRVLQIIMNKNSVRICVICGEN